MEKQELRERTWDELEERGAARFPFPPHGRIPNFAGADEAADRLAGLEAWRESDVLKSNPDAPQLPVRRRALHEGKTVYMAVPRLRDERCFFELDPDRLAPETYDDAATVSSVEDHARRVGPDAVEPVDLVVCGSVAVDEAGARVGTGEGYSNLEWAVLWEVGLVGEDTPVATTVHERQVRTEEWTTDANDVPVDFVVTPGRTVRTGATDTPTGIDWSLLADERGAEIPVLERLAPE